MLGQETVLTNQVHIYMHMRARTCFIKVATDCRHKGVYIITSTSIVNMDNYMNVDKYCN